MRLQKLVHNHSRRRVARCGCGRSDAKAAPPIKVGISLSLTGDFADPGKAAQRGYQLWAAEVNKAGGILGRQVEIKIVDDASSPDQVVTNYQNLITQDKVDIVFGPFSSLLTIPAARVAKRYGYSFIEPAGGGPKVFAAAPRQPLLRATRPGGEGWRRVRELHPGSALGPASEDSRLCETRRPLCRADCRLRQEAVRGGRNQDGLRSDLSCRSRPISPRSSPALPRQTPTSSFRGPSRRTHSPRSRR